MKWPSRSSGIAPWHRRSGTLVSQNVRMEAKTSIATILEFPGARSRQSAGALAYASVHIEFHSLKLVPHLCNVTCRPLTLWPSDRYGPRWAGREAWVTSGGGRTREVPADAARGSTPLMTMLPRHYHAGIVKHYHAQRRRHHFARLGRQARRAQRRVPQVRSSWTITALIG